MTLPVWQWLNLKRLVNCGRRLGYLPLVVERDCLFLSPPKNAISSLHYSNFVRIIGVVLVGFIRLSK